jgi:hypothetical protein
MEGIRTENGQVEAYVFERHLEGARLADLRSSFASMPGVEFVAQFVGAFSLFGRVVADDLAQLQGRIGGEYWDAGIHSDWSLNLTGDREAAPKRRSPDICALVCVRTTDDPFRVIQAVDDRFLDPERHDYGAAVVTARDFDLLVDLGGDTLEEVVDRVVQLRQVDGIGHTSTAIADLADNAIRPNGA